jgi:hypothetical protein
LDPYVIAESGPVVVAAAYAKEYGFADVGSKQPEPRVGANHHAEKRRIFLEVVPREPMRGIRQLLDTLTAAGRRGSDGRISREGIFP